jgi:DNA-binding HxlR family transcriptional regulator
MFSCGLSGVNDEKSARASAVGRSSGGVVPYRHAMADVLAETLDVLARRGTLAVFAALQGGSLTERALEARLRTYAPSVIAQRVADLRRVGAIEVVPENGDLRLSPRGRRLQGLLDQLGRWADG